MTEQTLSTRSKDPLEPTQADGAKNVPEGWEVKEEPLDAESVAPLTRAPIPGAAAYETKVRITHDRVNMRTEIVRDEGMQSVPKPDKVPDDKAPGKIRIDGATIGIGHNMRKRRLPEEIMEMLLDYSIDLAIAEQYLHNPNDPGMTPQERQAFKKAWKEKHAARPLMDGNWQPGQDIIIGYDYNLSKLGMPAHIVERLYQLDIQEFDQTARDFCKKVRSEADEGLNALDDVRQRVVINMAYNLGPGNLAGFKKFQQALEAGDYEEAARQMLSDGSGTGLSKWAMQTRGRAVRLAYMMVTGETWKHAERLTADDFPKALQPLVRRLVPEPQAVRPGIPGGMPIP